MYIIIDYRAPSEAKKRLSKYGNIIEFKTENIVYNAISGHPDIFITQMGGKYIIAPNTPEKYLNTLSKIKSEFEIGEKKVGPKYPETVYYNCVVTKNFLIHKRGYTDPSIIKKTKDRVFIDVPQSYSRCSLISLDNNSFITSDIGIYNRLKNNFDVLFVESKKILLPGFKHGFLGGTAGVFKNSIFFIGSLSYLEEEKFIRDFICSKGYDIIELYDGLLYDGGGIFFIER